ncbi:MAG: hypothetical protein A3I12_07930 [Gammaproteobacteria bacterium RIFCSPLOWO2_02_FULL_38_11]|nr:MAG: hypothetical protein A2W47_03295 [Gammaproteobacteria bacterium RIFCSPHIGHO2_12_38_15]OGT69406.1 MAG: hypothetical protein A3I12_07930 [Gammaproteobacteria bacterium RIFCSPLOWO2_02_FULL_38_11]
MKITYDPEKQKKTLKERGLNFVDSILIFEDIRKDYGEKRMIAVGRLVGRMVIVGYVQRGKVKHIFSMRKANEREVKKYQEQFKKD